MNKILLAYDGSDPSKRAAAKTGELAARLGVPVTVVTVGELAPSAYGTVAPVVDPEVFHQLLAEGVALVKQSGVEAGGRLLWGKPAEEIVELAGTDGCDTIVVGHRGLGGLQSLLLGSVAKHVIDHAPCSVLVVR
jgi:nucleotide-binding universal stress UspA family protein